MKCSYCGISDKETRIIYLGTFDTFEEAKQKRIDYEANLF